MLISSLRHVRPLLRERCLSARVVALRVSSLWLIRLARFALSSSGSLRNVQVMSGEICNIDIDGVRVALCERPMDVGSFA